MEMSSGQYKPHYGFNPIQIKNGMVVRLGKDGSVKIYRPMVFKAMVTQDMFGGMREVYMLKDWLVLSQDKVAAL